MRTEDAIRRDLASALADYRESANTLPVPQVQQKGERVKVLQRELSDAIVEGAEPCEDCGGPAIGIRHFKVEIDRGSNQQAPYSEYELGCGRCLHKRALSRGARHDDPGALDAARKQAVSRWNGMQYLDPKPWQVERAIDNLKQALGSEVFEKVRAAQPPIPASVTPADKAAVEQEAAYSLLRALRGVRAAQVNVT